MGAGGPEWRSTAPIFYLIFGLMSFRPYELFGFMSFSSFWNLGLLSLSKDNEKIWTHVFTCFVTWKIKKMQKKNQLVSRTRQLAIFMSFLQDQFSFCTVYTLFDRIYWHIDFEILSSYELGRGFSEIS